METKDPPKYLFPLTSEVNSIELPELIIASDIKVIAMYHTQTDANVKGILCDIAGWNPHTFFYSSGGQNFTTPYTKFIPFAGISDVGTIYLDEREKTDVSRSPAQQIKNLTIRLFKLGNLGNAVTPYAPPVTSNVFVEIVFSNKTPQPTSVPTSSIVVDQTPLTATFSLSNLLYRK